MNKIELFCILTSLLIIFGISNQENHIVIALGNVWSKIGNDLKERGNLTGAIAVYNKALMIEPKNKEILANKGDTLNLLGNHTGALAIYDKALRIDPSYVNALDGKGWALNELGN